MKIQAQAKGSEDKSQRSKVIGRRSLWNRGTVELLNCGRNAGTGEGGRKTKVKILKSPVAGVCGIVELLNCGRNAGTGEGEGEGGRKSKVKGLKSSVAGVCGIVELLNC